MTASIVIIPARWVARQVVPMLAQLAHVSAKLCKHCRNLGALILIDDNVVKT
jgi:hypothetical protein